MKRTSLRRAVVPGVAALALAASACAASNEGNGGTGSGGDASGLEGELAAGGASSQEAAQNAWIVGFQEVAPQVQVSYNPVGSGGGRENFVGDAFPFAGTDSYLDNEEGELDAATERCGGEAPIEIPNYISPIAVIYNLEGVDELKLSPETLAGIFAGKITRWNDKAIAETNPDADLPNEPINAVHRSDESGTTGNFTNYMSQVAGDVWDAGEVEVWPKKYGGTGGAQTRGVVSEVEATAGSIGYADASQAGKNGVALVGVGDDFVGPTAEAAAKILEASERVEGRADTSMVYDLEYDTKEAGVYPIVLTSYLIACPSYDDATEGELTKAYLEYVVSDEGQEFVAEEAGSAPLSDEVQAEAQEIIGQISAG